MRFLQKNIQSGLVCPTCALFIHSNVYFEFVKCQKDASLRAKLGSVLLNGTQMDATKAEQLAVKRQNSFCEQKNLHEDSSCAAGWR